MMKPWSVVDDDELARLRQNQVLLREALIAGAVWTGKCSGEWTRLLEIARESGIPGMVEELRGIEAYQKERQRILSGDNP